MWHSLRWIRMVPTGKMELCRGCSNQYILLRPVFRRIWQQAQLVYTNSVGLRDLAYQTAANQPIQVIPNGVDCNEFTPAAKKSPDGTLQILCVSRLIERKGINYLIDAMAHLQKAGINCQLQIVGEGNLLQDLKNQVSELGLNNRVELVGRLKHDELPGYYQKADIFILPSKNEGMSNTVLEAMAAGLPIITTRTGGALELVDKNGILISQEDSDDITRAVKHLVENPEERLVMGKHSRKTAQKFSWQEVARQYKESYQLITKNAE